MSGLGRILLYVRHPDVVAGFYARYFGFTIFQRDGDRIIELQPSGGGAAIMLHQSSKRQKSGKSLVKLVFDVDDVEDFTAKAAADGLPFGPIHKTDVYVFANAKDPAGNSIQISERWKVTP